MARFRKIGLKERGLYEFYKKNPGVPQAYWFRVRNFKTALDTMAEVMMNILTFDTIDSKMQTLAGKCYLEWAAQRRIDGCSLQRQIATIATRSLSLGRIGLLGNGLLNLLADVDNGEVDEASAAVGIEARGSFHQTNVTLANQIVHLKALALVLVGDGNHKTEVGFDQPVQGLAVALLDL